MHSLYVINSLLEILHAFDFRPVNADDLIVDLWCLYGGNEAVGIDFGDDHDFLHALRVLYDF